MAQQVTVSPIDDLSGDTAEDIVVGSAVVRPTRTDRAQGQAVQDQARRQGMKVSDRGRIPADLLDVHHLADPS